MDGSSDFFYKECICNAQGRSLQWKCSISKCHLVSVISSKIWLQGWLLSDQQPLFPSTRNRRWIKMAVCQLNPGIFRKQFEWNKFLLSENGLLNTKTPAFSIKKRTLKIVSHVEQRYCNTSQKGRYPIKTAKLLLRISWRSQKRYMSMLVFSSSVFPKIYFVATFNLAFMLN